MPLINNDTPIIHTSRNEATFSSASADLRHGVDIDLSSFNFSAPPGALAREAAEFGAWHALETHPSLKGFMGYDCVTYRYVSKKD